jgi:teichuronic acid biosynthesis glycosyltransferase TuaC
MKILLISNLFPNSAEPLRGIYTYQIVKELDKVCDIEVIAPLPWVPHYVGNRIKLKYCHADVPKKEKLGGITVYHPRYLVIPKILGFMHSVFLFFPLLRLVKHIQQNREFDLINAHWIFPDGVAAVWLARRLDKPVILTGLGCDLNLYSTMAFRKIQIVRALQEADLVTVVSKNMKRRIISLGIRGERVNVIPNGIDLKLFDVMDRKWARNYLSLNHKSRIILTIGTQDEVKGTKYLIEAFDMLRRSEKGRLLLILIGDGPLTEFLVSMSKDLGLCENVLFLGKKPHNEIPLWLNAADAFCLPSIREGHPNVVLEALACGVPVVASNVGGIPEMINDNGVLTLPADSNDLCTGLEFCMSKSWDKNAIRSTFGGFSWVECARMYLESYLRVAYANKGATGF